MSDALREIFGVSADNINLCLARDGSGVGAALIAAVMGEEFNVVSAVKTTATATTETVTAGTMTVEAPVAPSPSGRLTPKLFRKK